MGPGKSGRRTTGGSVRRSNKEGLYGVLTRWTAGNHFSRPHFHPHDRFIMVISGTWWVGSGPVFDPANASVPMPAGTFVTHYGKQVHWDGAKDVDAVLLDRRRGSGDCDAVCERRSAEEIALQPAEPVVAPGFPSSRPGRCW